MTVERKSKLLAMHSFLHLRLLHAAVGSYPIHFKNHIMPVNRLLMVFADSGRNDSEIRDLVSGALLPMRRGFLYFVPYNHEIDIKLSEKLLFVSLQFNLDLFYGFDVFKDYGRCVILKKPKLVKEIRNLMDREGETGTLCRVNEIIFNLCVFLLSGKSDDTRKEKLNWHKYENILNFIRKSGNAGTTVEKLAEMNGMRQDVFSRNFTRDMGITPKDFITSTLMRKASEMLLMPGISVRAVSAELKFSSEYYFSRFFKKHSGTAPKSFQRFNFEKNPYHPTTPENL